MQLLQRRTINAPIERLFDLVRSIQAHEATSSIDRRAVAGKTSGLAALNDITTWSARFFGLRFQISTRVTDFSPPFSLIENLGSGLLLEFGHVYTLRRLESGLIELEDCLRFAVRWEHGLMRWYSNPSCRHG
jgi:hypothetical protein